MNFYSELKKCGDELYKKKQFWEFVSIEGKSEYVNVLSQVLSLSTDYIKNNGGAWLVNSKKEWSGYDIDKSKVVNLFDQGIVDPTKVTRLALENAVSVAGTMLITEAVVSIGKKKKQPEVNPAMMGM